MDLKKIKAQSISIILNRGIIAFFSLLLEIFLIKYLTVEEKGEIFYIRSNIELLAYIFTFGLGFSIIHFRAKYGDKYDYQIVQWIIGSLFLLVMFSFIFYHIDFIQKYLFVKKEYFLPATIGSILMLISFFMQKVFLSDDNIKLHNSLIFFSKVTVSIALIIVSYFIQENKVYFLVVSIPLSLLIVDSFFLFRVKLNISSKEKNSDFLKYNINIYLYELLFQLKSKFDNFLVLYFLGVSAVGIFSVAVNFGAMVLIVSSSISLILLKEMSLVKNLTQKEINALLKKYIILMSLITILSIGFIYIVIYFFGQDKFKESFNVYCLYSISLLLFSVVTFFQSYFSSLKKTDIQLKSLIVSLIPYIFILLLSLSEIYELLLYMILGNLLQCIYMFYSLRYQKYV